VSESTDLFVGNLDPDVDGKVGLGGGWVEGRGGVVCACWGGGGQGGG
jgi:hypothetical protein